MRKLLLFALSGFILLGCQDEEDEPNPLFGIWYLQGAEIVDAPAQFSNYEGVVLSPSYFSFLTEKITINEDNTFLFSTEFIFQEIITSQGRWELDGENLLLIYEGDGGNDDELEEEYTYSDTEGTITIEFDVEIPISDSVAFPATTEWLYKRNP